jgi:hypothetical protein
MSADTKKGYGSTLLLMILGVLALYAGARWLLVLIPTAALVWYAATGASFRTSRNGSGIDDNRKMFERIRVRLGQLRIAQRAR